jgi:glucose/arabinose dehydrogenase
MNTRRGGSALGRLLGAFAFAALGLGAIAPAHAVPAASQSALRLVPVAHLDAPVYATAAPGEPGRLYVVEQAGQIVVIDGGQVRATPFLDIRSRVRSGGEQGLLSMAFDPRYASNHLFYVDYTDLAGNTRVVRYRASGDAALPSSARQLLFVKDFAPNHNGGQLQFGPDGRLYWGNGDGGGEGDPQDNGQNLTRPFAKIERLDVRRRAAHWHLVAYGLRNPWRFSFDSATGDLYIGDVGQDRWEEVDYLRRGFATPVNFGWKHFEGRHVYDGSIALLRAGHYVPPVYEYSHAHGCSISGGYVYRGHAVPAAVGRYFFGDYCSGTVWSLRIHAGRATAVRREPFTVPGLSSFGVDSAGELYLMSVTSGALYRLAG